MGRGRLIGRWETALVDPAGSKEKPADNLALAAYGGGSVESDANRFLYQQNVNNFTNRH